MNLKKRIITTILGISILGAGIMYANYKPNGGGRPSTPSTQKENDKNDKNGKVKRESSKISEVLLAVTTTTMKVINYRPVITGNGEVNPKIDLNYSSEVSGRVIYVNKNFEKGNILKKGTTLLKIDNLKYKNKLAETKLALSKSKVSLLEEERRVEQANLEWTLAGIKGDPKSSLVLRKPQLASSESAVEQSQAAYNSARQDFNNTILKAPFDIYVAEKNIDKGSLIQTGNSIATLYGIETYEIEIPLSQYQWNFLPINTNKGSEVSITDNISGKEWTGKIVRSEKSFSSTTRQRSLFIEIDKPIEKKLYSGIYTEVSIPGEELKDVWQVPETAINSSNKDNTNGILIVNKNNEIEILKVFNLFQYKGFAYIKPVETNLLNEKIKVISKPLVTYTVGKKVKVLGESNE
jgi:RND family efflux transporter MFP subunit